MGLWRRDRAGLIHHGDAESQHTSFRLAAHPAVESIAASIDTVGDAYDIVLMESTIGLYKSELIKQPSLWRTLTDVEIATVEWIEWERNAQ